MALFKFTASDHEHRLRHGVLAASSERDILGVLPKLGFQPIKVRPAGQFVRWRSRLGAKEKIFLARNLQVVLKAGLSLTDGLRVLFRDLPDGNLRDFLLHLTFHIEQGQPIHQSFADFGNSFTPIEIEMIRVGELSGNLATTFLRWAQDLERDKEINETITSALIYPAIILAVATGVVILLVTFVMPRIASLVKQIGQEVPLATRVIVDSSLFIGAHLPAFFGGFFILLIGTIVFLVSKPGRRLALSFFTHAPLLHQLALALALRNFCFQLGTLLNAGINLSESLALIEKTIFYPELREVIGRIRLKIVQGVDFGDALTGEHFLPGAFSGVLSIASKTGSLTEVIAILREYYEDEAKARIKNLLSLVEPLLLLFIGFVVGGIALAVLIPIYEQISTQLGST